MRLITYVPYAEFDRDEFPPDVFAHPAEERFGQRWIPVEEQIEIVTINQGEIRVQKRIGLADTRIPIQPHCLYTVLG